MSKLIKRKDGSYSKRGLWDNIRKNKGSGKKPTKDMLKQEAKIKKEENMKSMYKKGGKKMKGESFMEESKEIGFGAPGVKPPKRRFDLGGLMDKDKPKEQSTAPQPTGLGNSKGLPLPEAPNVPPSKREEKIGTAMQDVGQGIVKKRGGLVETGMDVVARGNRAQGKATMAGKKMRYKTGGVKKYNDGGLASPAIAGLGKSGSSSMGNMKGKAMPSELDTDLQSSGMDIGQNTLMAKKGGAMSKFKTMAAAGKKKIMGGKKC